MTTLTAARTAARAMGYTLRRSGMDSELVVYPVGTGADHAAAYFTDCPADALDTARAMAAHAARKAAPETVSRAPAILPPAMPDSRVMAAIEAADWLAPDAGAMWGAF